ncbi:MAG: glycosyltransferase [Acidocella sp.]|nr:glycosyltransferase [Acidocella sp.]
MTELQRSPTVQDKLLTILIPVYNGEKYLKNLLQLFADAYARMPEQFADVDLVVGNNVSTDGTQAVAESFVSTLPILRPLILTPHLPTAELNIFRAFRLCRGIFTWTLGVDDIPVFSSFGGVIDHLRAEQADMYLFNYAVVSPKMKVTRHCVFQMNQPSYAVNIVDVTQRFGFWSTVAGISGQIMRTASVMDYDLPQMYEKTTKVYVHVGAYLECFKDRRTTLINLPIVFYKSSPNDFVHWRKAAKLMDVCDEFFWTLGYVRLLVYLEEKSIIDSNYLKYMLETNERNSFRPIFIVVEKFSNQIMLMTKTDEPRNHLSEDEFAEISGYLARKEPFLREYLWKLREIFDLVRSGGLVSDSDWENLKSLAASLSITSCGRG